MTKLMIAPKPPVVLIIAPMPVFPTSAGNRRRLLETCEALKRASFDVDFAYFAHEDQIYRRFGRHPPTDYQSMEAYFRNVFRITPNKAIALRTQATHFGIDDWCPDELLQFVEWYQSSHQELHSIIVNYVFLSRCLSAVGSNINKIIDTHDRFTDRHKQYIPFRSEPNFFHTSLDSESKGLARADIILAIQEEEAAFFRANASAQVITLPPRVPVVQVFKAPTRIRRYGFIGHGNDANLFSVVKLISTVASLWREGQPELIVAGEICGSLAPPPRGVQYLGYVEHVATFYDQIDVVVAPMLLGTGLKMKVVEALSYGVPVLGTAVGFEGLGAVIAEHNHQCLHALAERIFALADDPAGLQDLSLQCEQLFDRYLKNANYAEKEFISVLQKNNKYTPIFEASDRPPTKSNMNIECSKTERMEVGQVLLTCQCSSHSLSEEDSSIGTLIATERWAVQQEQLNGYTTTRRRWFASFRSQYTAESDPYVCCNPFKELVIDHSREWVRGKSLPRRVREILAVLIAEATPDWTSEGRVIGGTPTVTLLNAPIPSDLDHAPAIACYLIDGRGRARSALLRKKVRLSVPLGSFVNHSRRYPITFQQSGLTLEMLEPRPNGGPTSMGRLLMLADDLMGVIDLRPAVAAMLQSNPQPLQSSTSALS